MARHFITRLRLVGAAIVAFGLLSACSPDAPTAGSGRSTVSDDDAMAAVREVQQIRNRYLIAAKDSAATLAASTRAFLATPDPDLRETFQKTWLDAHEAFCAVRPFLNIEDNEETLFLVDAWPMEPGFLDSLPEYPDSGIINDVTLDISRETLSQQHGFTDAEEVSMGFHALEYFAFDRPVDDFIKKEDEIIVRRRLAVAIIARELDRMINEIPDDWIVPRQIEGVQSTSALPQFRAILSGTQRSALDGFQQASLIVDIDQGHARFSQSSRAALLAQVKTLREVFARDSKVFDILVSLDAPAAENLNATLEQGLTALNPSKDAKKKDEALNARLPLILSAIGHQLEDLERNFDLRSL